MKCEKCGEYFTGTKTICRFCRAELRRIAEGLDGQGAARQDDSRSPRLPQQNINSDMIIGGIFFTGGLFLTGYTYMNASGGGKYFVTWGAILFGFIQFMRGLMRR